MKNKPVKILQVFGSLDMGGAECRMMDVYRNIDRTSFQFDFVTLTSKEQFFEKEIYLLGGKVFKVSSPREIGIVKHINEIRNCIKCNNYDAVHAHTSYHCGMVMLAAWLEHVPVRISHARTTGSQSKSKFIAVSLIIGRALISLFSTKKFAISNAAGRYVFGNQKFEVLPNAIDIYKYQVIDEAEKDKLREELGVSSSEYIVGQIGRFDPMKNHLFTVRWFEEFLKILPNARLVLVGYGQLLSTIKKAVNDLEINDKVILTGARDDVEKIIHLFDVLFFPSLFEGLGGVALEAQAAGIPVVESDTIPMETDMGLGLVQRVSLQDDLSVWSDAVLRSKELSRPTYATINEMFEKKNYTLTASINRLTDIYRGIQ